MALILRLIIILTATITLTATSVNAGKQDFKPGKAIPAFGMITDVPTAKPLAEGIIFKHTFDRSDAAEPGAINRSIESAARFINMHYAVGVPLKNIQVAMVIHGPAVLDVTKPKFYQERKGEGNANVAMIDALLKAGVRIIVCGQSATAQDVYADDVMPGVEIALSAMTAHAVLQMEGYTLNPF